MRAALLAMLLLAACSKVPTVIDGTSQETFERTTEQARRDLPIKDRLDVRRGDPHGRRPTPRQQ